MLKKALVKTTFRWPETIFIVLISTKENNTNRPTHRALNKFFRIKTVHHACIRPKQFQPVAAKRLQWMTVDERWMRALKSNLV